MNKKIRRKTTRLKRSRSKEVVLNVDGDTVGVLPCYGVSMAIVREGGNSRRSWKLRHHYSPQMNGLIKIVSLI
ncbi:hypothetical protein ACROYT_G036252 [Oculina patagonica]